MSGEILSKQILVRGGKPQFTFIDLFAGIGGIRLAFEKAGGRCVFSSEIDPSAGETYFENFGDEPAGDITKIKGSEIPSHDILLAGFPCQPFSLAGISKKKSMKRSFGFKDKTQGTLFFDIARILEKKRPRAFLLENVKHLEKHDDGKTFRTIRETLTDELGYDIHWQVIDADGLVPQHRERIFIVGFREPLEFEFPIIPRRDMVLRDILDYDTDKKYVLTDGVWKALQRHKERHRKAGNGFGYGLTSREKISRTLSARYYKDGAEILINRGPTKIPRRLTPRECARLMGFPESFKIDPTDMHAYRQFGNSVVVPLVSLIAKSMLESLTAGKKRVTLLDYAS